MSMLELRDEESFVPHQKTPKRRKVNPAFLRTISTIPRIFYNFLAQKPIALSFDISGACNLNCPYCYWQTSKRQTQLPLDKIVGLVKEYRRQGVIHATW